MELFETMVNVCTDSKCKCTKDFSQFEECTNEDRIKFAAGILGIPPLILETSLRRTLHPNHTLLQEDK